VQSNLIGQKIQALQEKHKVPVWAFAEVRKEGGPEGRRREGGGRRLLTYILPPSFISFPSGCRRQWWLLAPGCRTRDLRR
jgi:hypothetical protein